MEFGGGDVDEVVALAQGAEAVGAIYAADLAGGGAANGRTIVAAWLEEAVAVVAVDIEVDAVEAVLAAVDGAAVVGIEPDQVAQAERLEEAEVYRQVAAGVGVLGSVPPSPVGSPATVRVTGPS